MTDAKIEIRVGNLDCEHDAAAIERGLAGLSGLQNLTVYPKAAKLTVTLDTRLTSEAALREKLESLGFPPQKGLQMAEPPRPWKNPKVLLSVASGLLLLAGALLGAAGGPGGAVAALYLASLLVGGYYFGREALETLLFERKIGIELLMTVAAVVAAAMGLVQEGAMLAFLYSISEAAEGYTEEKTRAAVKALMKLTPATALVVREGREQQIPAEELQVGEVFRVYPGQALATDGEILVGSSSLNQSSVTGESLPVEKGPGDLVFAGTINGEGALEVRATRSFGDHTVARIIQLVEGAQEKKGKSQRWIERFGERYSPLVLLVGVLLALVPPLIAGGSWAVWIERATVFIVAAAPCALVISIPITMVASLGTGARQGVLIKGGVFLEELAQIQVVALDKTGTLTRSAPEITDLLPLGGMDAAQVLGVAAGIESRSTHPLARAIVRAARRQGLPAWEMQAYQSLTGAGAAAEYQGQSVFIGSPQLFRERFKMPLASIQGTIDQMEAQGKTVILVGDGGRLWGLLALRDALRPNARQAVAALHQAGVKKVVMLTGDNLQTAQALAAEVGLDEVYAGLKPEDKAAWVRRLKGAGEKVAMVGDGVNDAPALAEASVGVAMGAAGTDAALETADVALMGDDLEKLAYALQLARRNQRVVQQNLALSAVVIGALIVGAVAGLLPLPVAVLAHELSEFAVIGSGLRMLRG